jgi:hypothetical protein
MDLKRPDAGRVQNGDDKDKDYYIMHDAVT